MKKRINIFNEILGFVVVFFMLTTTISCDSIFDDVRDLSNYPGTGTFNDVQTSQAYLSALYASTFGGWPVNMGNNADEGAGIIGSDWVTTDNGTMKYWAYDAIRRINILLEELPLGTVDESEKELMIGQAKFLRAFHYFKMVYYHGGVPIIKLPQSLSDELEVSRNSTKECFDFIIEDLDDAIEVLPDKFSGDNRGRVDKASALAFKGRVLLYKASPQFNSSNPYNNQYWVDAYNANKAAKDFLDSNGYGLLEDYTDVFLTKGHAENVLSVIYRDPVKRNGRREDGVRPLSESKNATGFDQPIWAVAEAYPMLDGRMPGDPESKYSYDVQTFWQNRDPRFEANLVWNGAVYELSGKSGRRQYTMTNIAESVDAFGFVIQGEHHYRTGLYTKKGLNVSLPSELVDANDTDWPEIRYTEVLFNYAEAANETGSPEEAIEVLKDIRARAGIEPGEDNMFGLSPNMTREETREAILQEKYIEMLFEGHRFWDLRRHRLLHRLDGMRKYGIMAMKVNGRTFDQITPEDSEKARNYQLLPEDFEYEVVELITTGPTQMVMPETYYFFPIQLSHIDRNPNLEQNAGWGGTFDPEL